jgi:hypothetical protein
MANNGSDWLANVTRPAKLDFASVAASKPKERDSWKEKVKSSPIVPSPVLAMPPSVPRDENKSYQYEPGFILALNKSYGLPSDFEKTDQIVIEEVLGLGNKEEVPC